MIMVFLTVGVATTYARIQGERRTDQDRQSRIESFSYAQTALERFAAERRTFGFTASPPAPVESTTIGMPGGAATVVLRRIKQKTPTRPALYLLTSRGVRRTGSVAWTPAAEQVAAQYAIWREPTMQILAGWTSLNGIAKGGGAGTLSGIDGCGVMPPVAGVAVVDHLYTQSGGSPVPTGNPDILDLGLPPVANQAVHIDWEGILNGNAMPADLVVPPGAWPASFPAGWWPVIRVDGDLTLPSSGRGTLIVKGDLRLNGSVRWDGVVLVGGAITSNGANAIQGATISGLNRKLGVALPGNDIANGAKTFQYNSCNVVDALGRFSMLVLVPKTWSDNWAAW